MPIGPWPRSLCSACFEGPAWVTAMGPDLWARHSTVSGASPTDLLLAQRPAAWGPPDPGRRLPCLCAVPEFLGTLEVCPGGARHFPFTGSQTHSDSSVSRHTTGLGPSAASDQLVSPAQTPGSNKCWTKKEGNKTGREEEGEGWAEFMYP